MRNNYFVDILKFSKESSYMKEHTRTNKYTRVYFRTHINRAIYTFLAVLQITPFNALKIYKTCKL